MPYNADEAIKLYTQAKSIRSTNEADWRSAAAYCLPAQYASWQTEGPSPPLQQSTAAVRRVQYDSTAARSLPKYTAILERIATPNGQRWHGMTASDTSLRKKYRVRKYFDEFQDLLFQYRYAPRAGFRTAFAQTYGQMGVYGNGPIFIGQSTKSPLNTRPGFRYISVAMRDFFVIVDDEGAVVGAFRRFFLNARQFEAKWQGVALPGRMMTKDKPGSETDMHEFVHFVYVRSNNDYDPESLYVRRHPVCAHYIHVDSQTFIGGEQGFRSLPYKMPRPFTLSGNPYGYSPAILGIAAMGGASQIKKSSLKLGNRIADPTLLVAADDGIMGGNIDMRPGMTNSVKFSANGRPLVVPLPTGDMRVNEVLLQDERHDIEDCFFVTLFQILQETPEMTATEVVERVAEKASLISPTMGQLQMELLGPDIEREVEMSVEMGIAPRMPPELIEAAGEYEIQYTSPLAKGMYAEEISGFMRSVEMSLRVTEATQDASHLDHYNFDAATPEIADFLAVPARWMENEDGVKAKREARQEQADTASFTSGSRRSQHGQDAFADARSWKEGGVMSEPADGFVDGEEADPYDPAQAAAVEQAERQNTVITDEAMLQFIRQRKVSYSRVFSTTECTPGELEFVMLDLARFCRAFDPTWNRDQKRQDLLEGRREVFLRIKDYTLLDLDTLFIRLRVQLAKEAQNV